MYPLNGIRTILTAACGLTLLGPLAETAFAAAPDSNPVTDTLPRGLPYEGHLDIDGVPLNGTLTVRFALWNLPAGGAMLFDEFRDVSFINGRFSVLLGAGDERIPPIVFDAADVYLGVTVNNTELMGRQRIVPVPHALWAARAADFTVAGRLTLNGVLDAAAASVGELTAADAAIGTLSAGSLNLPLGIQGVSGFRMSAEATLSFLPQESSIDMGVSASDGMCFITSVSSQEQGFVCTVGVDGRGQWTLSAERISECSARCLILK